MPRSVEVARPVIGRSIEGLDHVAEKLRTEAARRKLTQLPPRELFVTQVGEKQYRNAPEIATAADNRNRKEAILRRAVDLTKSNSQPIAGTELSYMLKIKPGSGRTNSMAGITARIFDLRFGSGPGDYLLHADRNAVRENLGLLPEIEPQPQTEFGTPYREVSLVNFYQAQAAKLDDLVEHLNERAVIEGWQAAVGGLALFEAQYSIIPRASSEE